MPWILDATCGNRGFWAAHSPKDLVCIDIRLKVNPDIVADAKHLPFRDGVFQSVFFDPPHRHGEGGMFKERFGGFGSYDDLRLLFQLASREFYRVLIPSGILVTKLTETSQPRNSRHHEGLLERQIALRFGQYAEAAGLRQTFAYRRYSRGMSRTAKVVWLNFRKVVR